MFQKVRSRSHFSQRPRRIPRQPRGRRRVSQLLAAAAVIASVGYDAATMSAIAAKAVAPIGSLYQFFPNKVAITHALQTEYGKHYEAKLTAAYEVSTWAFAAAVCAWLA
jgi:AcrR family transcriptional regulator